MDIQRKEEEQQQGLILVGITYGEDISYSMEELEGLVHALGKQVIGHMIQKVEKVNTKFFIGKGKAHELMDMVEKTQAKGVVFNDQLSGSQIKNLEEVLGCAVIDRTILILDIFAQRATSKEGKLQVEMAQLEYRLPRLVGFGKSLSRIGGGMGTKGPGEKKLETDRRHIHRRIDDIKRELAVFEKTRAIQKMQREKSDQKKVALVGYTNGGKSSLMNAILCLYEEEGKQVESKDMLFATLDTRMREIRKRDQRSFLLIDTVGFVSKLPHTLINAFKSTLEEVKEADLIIHLIDGTGQEKAFQREVTMKVLEEIGAGNISQMVVYNKLDQLESRDALFKEGDFWISAKTGENILELVEKIEEEIFKENILTTLLIPYDRGNVLSYVCSKGNVIKIEHEEDGTCVKAELSLDDFRRVSDYVWV